MIRYKINLKSIHEVKAFVQIASGYDFDIDLSSGRYVVDAKSIMGIFSLDLTRPIDLEIHSDDIVELEKEIQSFLI